MKTLRLAGLLLCLWLYGCSKSEDGPGVVETDEGISARYTLLLKKEGTYTSAQFHANAISIGTVTDSGMAGEPFKEPELTYKNRGIYCFYRSLPDCSGELRFLDLASGNGSVKKVFGDNPSCGREITALACSENMAYIGYSMPGTGIKETVYVIKATGFGDNADAFPETALEKAPLQLVWSNNRLFVLSYDSAISANFLLVLNGDTGILEQELNLDTGVQQLLPTPEGNLLISYPTRHLLLDPVSLEVLARVVYAEGKEPNIGGALSFQFDASNNLYYAMPTAMEGTTYAHIPAVYDLSNHIAYLYYYENFLNENERNIYYSIADTRVVGYDHHNGLLLIGYQKPGSDTGGLLRIKPVPEPKFIDQVDLQGIPVQMEVY